MLALFSDCVRVENRGWTGSETMVSENLEKLIGEAARARDRHDVRLEPGAASSRWSTSPHRLGRKVAVAGRSMDQNLKVAGEIGYLGAPPGDADRPAREQQHPAEQAGRAGDRAARASRPRS